MEISEKDKIDWLRVARSENVGSVTFRTLRKFHSSPAEILEALPGYASKGGGNRKIKVCGKKEAEEEYRRTLEMGGQMLMCEEAGYPQALRATHDFPPFLSVFGHAHLLNKPAVAIVGSRDASLNGKQIAKKLAYDLAENEYVVVSGMAFGIDRKAHEGALAGDKGATVAVLGCGIDKVYPPENKDIYEEIKERGAIISEYPLGMPPSGPNFPRRNRIIAGMSAGTLVIEAKLKSGSLITARLALEQGKPVFAVPGSPLDIKSQGSNQLIKDGAVLTESVKDILDELQNFQWLELREPRMEMEDSVSRPLEEDTERVRELVKANLSPAAVAVDNIIRETGLSYSLVSYALMELELAGRIERFPGNKVALIG